MRWFVVIASLLTLMVLSCPLSLTAQGVGDRVVLASPNPAGVPVHPGPSDNSYARWANGGVYAETGNLGALSGILAEH